MNQDPLLPANLHYFHAAAREGSFHAAARACVVSQPTISKAVQALEAELGVALFDRIKHRVYLTVAGRELAALCDRLGDQVAAFRTELERLQAGPPRGPVRLAALRTMGTGILPELAASVARDYPDIALSFTFAAPGEIHDLLRLGSADLGVVPGPSPPDLDRDALGRDDAMLVVAPHSRTPGRINHHELARLPLILTSRANPYWAEHLAPFFSSRSLEPRIAMEVDQGEAIIALVERDLGASILPGHLAAGTIAAGRLRRVEVDGGLFHQDLELVTLKGRSVSPATHAVGDRLRAITGSWLLPKV
ncbi:MAG: LysR family transcriptional regulator [Candidatus Sericytochromatia bacterium]|nr:LysR family transcriptional regulator [Candidatus Tanganyikabacteria bacterium]